jgi:type VI secretion system protein ImpG
MSLNYVSLMKAETLRGMLSLYNFHALVDRQAARANDLRLAGMTSVRATSEDIFRRGATYRGVAIHLEMREDSFTGEGEVYLFSSVLNHFLNLYATVNCFTRLTVRGTQHGGVTEWPPMLGQQALL